MEIQKVFDLIERNDFQSLQSLKQLLLDGYDVNSADKDGYTLLHMAVDFDNEGAVRLILSTKGCNINAYTHCHRLYALHFAAQDGKTHLVSLLLDCGADIDCVTQTNCTALYFAVSSDHLQTARLLLERGSDPNIMDSNSISPLLKAVPISRPLTQLLLENKAKTSEYCRELHSSFLSNKCEVADLLLDNLSPPLSANGIGMTPLQNAVQHISTEDPKQCVDLIERLIGFGEDINIENRFGGILHKLIQRNKFTKDMVSDRSSEAMFQYLLSLDNCHLNIFIALNGTGTPLTLALRLNKYFFAEALIRAGADVNACHLNGFKYTKSADLVLKLLFYSGFHFQQSFAVRCRPISDEDVESFEAMVVWLRDKEFRVKSLKDLMRVYIRNKFNKNITKIVQQLDQHFNCPLILKQFILLNEIK